MALAQIAAENPETKKASFSCQKRATEGSSFYGLEKQLSWLRICSGWLEKASKNC